MNRIQNLIRHQKENRNIYSGIDSLPSGKAQGGITKGCLVLPGGGWRGLYTQGALDALMISEINLQTVVGVSAGALAGVGYLSRQIGYTARINLTYRHDQRYCGARAALTDHGITGFSFLFTQIMKKKCPFDLENFYDPDRRYIAVATNLETGRPVYFERGKCRIFRAMQASATVPYISRPVLIDNEPYLDGGMSVHVPYDWAKKEGFDKIVVILTRDVNFRSNPGRITTAMRKTYKDYPKLMETMEREPGEYNDCLDRIEADVQAGRTFRIAPSSPVRISRFEGNMEKLGELYHQGFDDTMKAIPELRRYLGLPDAENCPDPQECLPD